MFVNVFGTKWQHNKTQLMMMMVMFTMMISNDYDDDTFGSKWQHSITQMKRWRNPISRSNNISSMSSASMPAWWWLWWCLWSWLESSTQFTVSIQHLFDECFDQTLSFCPCHVHQLLISVNVKYIIIYVTRGRQDIHKKSTQGVPEPQKSFYIQFSFL